MARMKTVRDISAGGVVFRRRDSAVEVVLVGRLHPERWSLPKGTPVKGESLVDAARREVQEETGLVVNVLRPLGSVDYWFVLEGVRHFKTVYYYLMEAIAGDISRHDWEHEAVQWFPLTEAMQRISYANERQILQMAEQALTRPGETGPSCVSRLSRRRRSAASS